MKDDWTMAEQLHNHAVTREVAAEFNEIRAEMRADKARIAKLEAENARLRHTLEMVRDADNDCHKDGLPTIPLTARAAIDGALQANSSACDD